MDFVGFFSEERHLKLLSKPRRHVIGGVFACARLSLLQPNVNALSVDLPPALLVVTTLFSMLIDDSRV